MSEHHHGAWGSSREDAAAVWWSGALASSDYQQSLQSHHLLNQHHQQQLAAVQQQQQQAAAAAAAAVAQQQQQQQQHHQQQSQHDARAAAAASTAAAAVAQQLFSYKMASSFQNPSSVASTMTSAANVMSSSSIGSCMRGGYDYARLSDGMVGGGGAGGMLGDAGSRGADAAASALSGAAAAAAAANWWYAGGMGNAVQNIPTSNAQMVQQNKGFVSSRKMPRGKADAKPRGRMTAYAFFVQTCREEHKKKHPDENVIFAEFSKKCAERWKTMVDKEKKRFHEMAEKDKKRYDTEMEGYTPPKGEKGRGKRRKHMKDPNAPKRSLSAFFWFCNDERSKVKAMNPEFGVGEIAKELGRRWSDCSPEVKSKYEAMAEKDKARYDREMTAYKKRPKTGAGGASAPAPKGNSGDEDEDEDEDDDAEDEDE